MGLGYLSERELVWNRLEVRRWQLMFRPKTAQTLKMYYYVGLGKVTSIIRVQLQEQDVVASVQV
jgi:hypothetical protein